MLLCYKYGCQLAVGSQPRLTANTNFGFLCFFTQNNTNGKQIVKMVWKYKLNILFSEIKKGFFCCQHAGWSKPREMVLMQRNFLISLKQDNMFLFNPLICLTVVEKKNLLFKVFKVFVFKSDQLDNCSIDCFFLLYHGLIP